VVGIGLHRAELTGDLRQASGRIAQDIAGIGRAHLRT
jgi:hypothetical protein